MSKIKIRKSKSRVFESFDEQFKYFLKKRARVKDIRKGATFYIAHALGKDSFMWKKNVYQSGLCCSVTGYKDYTWFKTSKGDSILSTSSACDCNLFNKLNKYNYHLTFTNKDIANKYIRFCEKYNVDLDRDGCIEPIRYNLDYDNYMYGESYYDDYDL